MRWRASVFALALAALAPAVQADRPQWAWREFPFAQAMNMDAVYQVTHADPPQLLATIARWGVDVRRVPSEHPVRPRNPRLAAVPEASSELLRRAGFRDSYEGLVVCGSAPCCGLGRDTILIRDTALDYTLIHEFVQSLLRPLCPDEPDDAVEARFSAAFRRLNVYQRRLYDDPYRLLDPLWRRDIHAAQVDVARELFGRIRLGQSQEAIVEQVLARYIDARSPYFNAERRAQGRQYGQLMIDNAIDVFNAVNDSNVFVEATIGHLRQALRKGDIPAGDGAVLGDDDVAEAQRSARAVDALLAPVRAELHKLKQFFEH